MGYLFVLGVLRCENDHKILKSKKIHNMKNSFKTGLLALAIAVSFAACKGSGSSSAADSTKADSAKVDSAKTDSAATVDSAAKTGAAAVDSVKKDTTKK
jgi:hypothetical protein